MKIKYITIEGMHKVQKVTYNFDSMNYIHGPNGAGKSTVMEAIQLALLGYIPMTGKTKESIYKHSNGKMLAVTCGIDNDGSLIKVTRVWAGTPSNIKSSVEIEPAGIDLPTLIGDLELPIFNFNEFIGMTANKLKDWFINFLPSEYSKVDWATTLKKCLEDHDAEMSDNEIKELIDEVSEYQLKGVEEVRKFNEILKAILSAKKTELTRIQNSIQTLVYYDDCDSSMSVEEVNNKINELNQMLSASHKAKLVAEANKKIKDEIERITPDIEEKEKAANEFDTAQLRVEYDEYEKELSIINVDTSELSRRITEVKSEIVSRQNIIKSNGTCPFTSTECRSISEQRNKFLAEVAQLEEELKELNDAVKEKSKKADECKQRMYVINDTINKYELFQSNLIYMRKRIEDLRNQISDVDEKSLEIDEVFVSSEISRFTQMIGKIEANKRYNQLADNLTTDKFAIEKYIEAIKALIKLTDANGLQTQMMIAPFENLAQGLNKSVQLFFGNNTTAAFFLSEKANSFSFGVERDEKYIPFDLLSSGEKCIFALILMMSIVRLSSSKMKLILVDDLIDHLDDSNADKLFESLSTIEDIQFILAGVKECKVSDVVVEIN